MQQSLFPAVLEISPADTVLLSELIPDLKQLGYQLEPFGSNAFVVQGTPVDTGQGGEIKAIENLLEQYKHFSSELKFSKREKLLRSMALQQAIKTGTVLSQQEMKTLTEELFLCTTPNTTPNGKPVFLSFRKDETE